MFVDNFYREDVGAHSAACSDEAYQLTETQPIVPYIHETYEDPHTVIRNNGERSISSICDFCGEAATLTSQRLRVEYWTYTITDHFFYTSKSKFRENCHTHEKLNRAEYFWTNPVKTCTNPNCGG